MYADLKPDEAALLAQVPDDTRAKIERDARRRCALLVRRRVGGSLIFGVAFATAAMFLRRRADQAVQPVESPTVNKPPAAPGEPPWD